MADWDVVGEAPVGDGANVPAQPAADPWAVVHEAPAGSANDWSVAGEAPVAPAPAAAPSKPWTAAQRFGGDYAIDHQIASAAPANSPQAAFDTSKAPGMLAPGNLDPWNRPVLQNPDGSYSTTSSISIGTDKGEVLIPTVVDGNRLTNEQAIARYRKTGENFGTFDTPDNADTFATQLHNAQAARYDAHGKPLAAGPAWHPTEPFGGEFAEQQGLGSPSSLLTGAPKAADAIADALPLIGDVRRAGRALGAYATETTPDGKLNIASAAIQGGMRGALEAGKDAVHPAFSDTPETATALDVVPKLQANKKTLDDLSTKVWAAQSQVKQYDLTLAPLKAELDTLAKQSASGVPVDKDGYNAKVNHFNALLKERNDILAASKPDQDAFDKLQGETKALAGKLPAPDTTPIGQLLATPFEKGWKDPSWWAANITHGAAYSSPSLAAGAIGTALGGGPEEPAGLALGAAGFGLGGAMQSLGPAYQRARMDGLDHDQAVDRAIKVSGVEGVTNALMALAPEYATLFGRDATKALRKPISEALFQIFGAQPILGVTGQTIQSNIEGHPMTPGEQAASYIQQAGIGAAIVGGHKLADGIKRAPSGNGALGSGEPGAEGPEPSPEAPAGTETPPAPQPPPKPSRGPSAAPVTPQPASRAFTPGEEIGLTMPGDQPPQRVKIVGSFQNGRFTTIQDESGQKRDVRTDELARDAVDVPARTEPEQAPTPEGAPASEAERFDIDGPYTPPAKRREPKSAADAMADVGLGEYTAPAERAQQETADAGPVEPATLGPQPERSRVTPGSIATEHQADVSALEAEAARRVAAKGPSPVAMPTVTQEAKDNDVAASQTAPAPTAPQKEAGNYQKGKINFQGLNISVETPKGAVRSGVGAGGQPWSNTNDLAHYGYIRQSTAKDGDHVDAYIGPNTESQKAYVIDQIDPKTGAYDEAKTVLGVDTPEQATAIYDAGFSDGSGPERRAAIKEVPLPEFKNWVRSPAAKKPIAEQKIGTDVTPPSPIDPFHYLKPARALVARRGVSLAPESVAKRLGVNKADALRVLASLAATPNSGIRIARDGTIKRTPVSSEPQDLLQFLAGNGGLGANQVAAGRGDLQAIDAHRHFVPGYGMLVRAKGGMPLDRAREIATEAGYGPYSSVNDLMAAISENVRGKKQYSAGDADKVEAKRGIQAVEADRDQSAEAREGMRKRHVLMQRARQLGIAVPKNWALDDIDAAITEREAVQAEQAELTDLANAREQEVAEGFDELRGLYDPLDVWASQHDVPRAQTFAEEPEASSDAAERGEPENAAAAREEEPESARPQTEGGGADAVPGNEGEAAGEPDLTRGRDTAQFEANLRKTQYTSNPAAVAPDGRAYRIKREGGGYIAMQMSRERGAPPKYFRAPKGQTWTEDEAVRHIVNGTAPPYQPPALKHGDGSWVIVDRATGKSVAEIFKGDKAIERLNADKYEAVPAGEYLASLNSPSAKGGIPDGEVGMHLGAGEIVRTATGRETSPFPKVATDTNRKASNTVKNVDRWLMQNALDEARARGDDFVAQQFEGNLEKPSQADKDSAEHYLFDRDFVRKPTPPLTRPLTEEPGADGLPQTVIPGAEQNPAAQESATSERAKAEMAVRQKQSKVRRGGQESVLDQEGGLFDQGRGQADLLSPKSEPDDGTPMFQKIEREQTLADRLAEIRDNPDFKAWFGNSKVVNADGTPAVVFRGDYRDTGPKLKKSATTSARFYFTEDPEIASNYATGKAYIDDRANDYADYFRFPPGKGERRPLNLDQLWYRLSPEVRGRLLETLMRARKDDETGDIRFDGPPDGGISSLDHWSYEIRAARGNLLTAAKEIWLNSGAIFNDEDQFMKILRHAGIKDGEFDDPREGRPVVTPALLSIQRPLDAMRVTAADMARLKSEIARDRTRPKRSNDIWNKDNRTPKDWLAEMESEFAKAAHGGDVADVSDSHIFTSIPEKIVHALQRMGYDGIDDRGGKNGGPSHRVWIAFEPNQIKSVFNRGTFAPDSNNIMHQRIETEPPDQQVGRDVGYDPPAYSLIGGLFGGPAAKPKAPEPASETVGIGADLKRLIDLFGPKMYGANMPQVTAKELLQNSFDAVKSAYKRGDIKPGEGRIDVALDPNARTLTFTDNGSGMAPETVKNAFLTVAGTNKDDLAESERSGGFGVAKLAFIFGNEELHLVTVRDGVKTSLHSSGKELLDGKAELKTAPTHDNNGTTVSVKFPEKVKNANGDDTYLSLPHAASGFDIFKRPLLGDVQVYEHAVNGMKTESDKLVPIGAHQDMKGMERVTTAHFPWGDIDLYMGDSSERYPAHDVLSSGLHQFSEAVRKRPYEWESLPYRLVFDVRPTVDASHPYYPFNNQREGWSHKVKPDIEQLTSYLQRKYAADQSGKLGGTFASTQMMPTTRTATRAQGQAVTFSPLDLRAKLPNADEFAIDPEISIEDGNTFIGGRKVDVSKGLRKRDTFSPDKFRFDPSDVPSNQPYFHSNLDRDVIQTAADRFGIDPNQGRHFFAAVGTVMQDFRDALRDIPGAYRDYWNAPGRPVGISIDKEYHGVHITVPFTGMFLNPLGVKTSSAGAQAAEMIHTLFHEAAHTVAKSHDEKFTHELARLEGVFEDEHAELKGKLQSRLKGIIEANNRVFMALREVFNDADTKNVGQDQSGASRQARDEQRGAAGLFGRPLSVREEQQLSQVLPEAGGASVPEGASGRELSGSDGPSYQRIEPDAPGVTPPTEDHVEEVAEAVAGEAKRAGNGVADFAREIAQGAREPAGDATKRLGWVGRHIVEPRSLARMDTRSAKYWNARKGEEHEISRATHFYRELARPYLEMPAAARAKVDQVLELDRWAAIDRPNDGRAIVARNTGFEDTELTRPGDIIELSGPETAAYHAMRTLFKTQWRNVIEATAKRFGWDGDASAAAIREAAEDPTSRRTKGERASLKGLADLIDGLERQERTGYVPLMRHGDYYIAIRPKPHQDRESLGGMPETVRFELVDTSPAWEQLFGDIPVLSGREHAGGIPKRARDRMAALQAKYPEADFDYSHGYLKNRPEALRSIDIPAIEKFLLAIQMQDEGLFEPLAEQARKAMYEELKAGFKRHANVVAGYDKDFGRSIGSYSYWIARHVGDLLHRENIERQWDQVMQHPDRNVRDFWTNWKRDDERGIRIGDRVARGIQAAGFYYVMAGNPSAALITFDAPLVAHSVLSAGVGAKTITPIFAGAMKDGMAALRGDLKEGIHLDILKMARDDTERAFLQDMMARGEIGRQREFAADFGAITQTQSQIFGEYQPVAKRALEISTSAFLASNELSRAITALTAFRALRKPDVMRKMARAWSKNQVFRDMVRQSGLSAQAMARFLTAEAAFEWGKRNRPEMARGPIGGVFWQFKQFMLRYVVTLKNLMLHMGKPGIAAAALMLGSLWVFAGVQGLPFAQDIENFLDFLGRQFKGEDPQIKAALYRLLDHAGLGKVGADVTMRGPVSVMFGTDVSNRYGFGDLVSQPTSGVEFLGAGPSIFYQALIGANRRYGTGQGWMAAFAQAAPSGLRNPMQGLLVYPQQGILTQRGVTVIPKKDIGVGDMAARTFGFQGIKPSRAYDKMEYERRTAASLQGRVDAAYGRLANLLQAQQAARVDGNTGEVQRISQVMQHFIQANPDLDLKIDTARDRYVQRIMPSEMAIKRAPRRTRADVMDNPYP